MKPFKIEPPRLAILTPTRRRREEFLSRLTARLSPQIADAPAGSVVWLLDEDEELSIGAKRNRLVERAATAPIRASYCVHVDDDDLVATDYVARIIEATERQPDCIGIKMLRSYDGKPWGLSIHSRACEQWLETPDPRNHRVKLFLRPITHTCPVKTEIARRVQFPDTSDQEDRAYAEALIPHLRSEVFVGGWPLYEYQYRSPGTRNEPAPCATSAITNG